jgi:hypothetical protein
MRFRTYEPSHLCVRTHVSGYTLVFVRYAHEATHVAHTHTPHLANTKADGRGVLSAMPCFRCFSSASRDLYTDSLALYT